MVPHRRRPRHRPRARLTRNRTHTSRKRKAPATIRRERHLQPLSTRPRTRLLHRGEHRRHRTPPPRRADTPTTKRSAELSERRVNLVQSPAGNSMRSWSASTVASRRCPPRVESGPWQAPNQRRRRLRRPADGAHRPRPSVRPAPRTSLRRPTPPRSRKARRKRPPLPGSGCRGVPRLSGRHPCSPTQRTDR